MASCDTNRIRANLKLRASLLNTCGNKLKKGKEGRKDEVNYKSIPQILNCKKSISSIVRRTLCGL